MKDLVILLSRNRRDTCTATGETARSSESELSCEHDYTTGFTANDRRKLVADMRYYASGTPSTVYGQVLDLSCSGTTVWAPEKVPTGEPVSIRIQVSQLDVVIDRSAVVCWLGFKGQGDWNVGLAFREKIAEETLLKLANHGYLERRGEPRREMSRLARIRPTDETDQGTDVLLDDWSDGGFCMRSPWPLEPGQRFVLDVRCEGDLTVTLPAEVRWKKAVDGGYSIGCRFAAVGRRTRPDAS